MAAWLRPGCAALAFLLSVACGSSSGPSGGGGGATLSGTVRSATGGAIVAGAVISAGTRQATSDQNGHYDLSGLQVGSATVKAQLARYLTVQVTITINPGANTHDFTLAEQEVYPAGPIAAFVPAGVTQVRGAIVILGGPNTSGFVTGGRIAPAGDDALEASLQSLGTNLRALAKMAKVVLVGSSTTAMPDGGASDGVLFTALQSIATFSGHAELGTAPVLMFGLSAGAPEASGLVSRNPARAIGLLARVPTRVTSLTAPAALAVPSFVMQADSDITRNPGVLTTFSGNRLRGGLWSLAVEPGVNHATATAFANGVVITWISEALALRLPAAVGGPLVPLVENAGWLGDQTTLEIAPWATFPGDPASASWLLSASAASFWKALGTPNGGNP